MPRDPKKYLHDVLSACRLARDFATNKTLEQYRTDRLVQSAIERQLSIAGEALTQLKTIFPEIASKITDHRRITAFRNILVHGYAEVDPDIVWKVLQEDLPLLEKEAQELLNEGQ